MLAPMGKATLSNLPREEPKKRKRRVDTRTGICLVGRIDLTSTTETNKGTEHAWAHETHESQYQDLCEGVVVIFPPSRWTVKDISELRTRVLAATATELVDFCLCASHSS